MDLAVLSTGIVSAIGFNALTSCAAIRAGISGISETYLNEYTGSIEHLRGGKVELPQWWDSVDRLVDLVAPAIIEALNFIDKKERKHVPLLIGTALPEMQFLGNVIEQQLLAKIEAKLGLPHHLESRVLPIGQTAGIQGLKIASMLLTKNISACIIAGTDSYLQKETIKYYMAQRRLMTSDNSNGFFPGESGSAVLIGLSSYYPQAILHILGIGESKELVTIYSEEIFRANGMTKAIRNAVTKSGIKLSQISCRFTDVNGEYYKFREGNIAIARFNNKNETVDMDIWHPIEFTGEIGAAIVPLLLGLALDAGQKGYNPGKYLLFHVGNDKEDRGALITRYGPSVDE